MKRENLTVKLSDIKLNEDNPRTINDRQMKRLVKSIQDFPEMTQLRPIVVDENKVILGGNMRYRAMQQLGYADAEVVKVSGLTDEQKREFIIKDNVPFGEWDWEELANSWDADELNDWGLDVPKAQWADTGQAGGLVDDFVEPPFSVLDTTSQRWKERRGQWLSVLPDSRDGRPDELLGKGLADLMSKINPNTRLNGTSEFDPYLCEIMYKWFAPANGSVLDPFAGGAVRGIVAATLGLKYTGIDLRPEQVKANVAGTDNLQLSTQPKWVCGDSQQALQSIDSPFDFVFSCPPYFELEKYSDDPRDLSNMQYDEFLDKYQDIISQSMSKLADDSFAAFVVSEVRDKKGNYRGLIPATIEAFEKTGAKFYNEIILVNSIGSAAVRARKTFNSGRKVVRIHQNILVFVKGNPKVATSKLKEVDFYEEGLQTD